MPGRQALDPNRYTELSTALARHHERVRAVCRILCAALGVPYTPELDLAAGLHDIGRLPIIQVTGQPRALTEEERALIRAHPAASAAVLAAAGLQEAARIALAHHERWDGAGYPNGLAGHRIPLQARILAAADAIAAMTERRPYAALADLESELRAAAGTQLDPDIARAALAALPLLRRLPE